MNIQYINAYSILGSRGRAGVDPKLDDSKKPEIIFFRFVPRPGKSWQKPFFKGIVSQDEYFLRLIIINRYFLYMR